MLLKEYRLTSLDSDPCIGYLGWDWSLSYKIKYGNLIDILYIFKKKVPQIYIRKQVSEQLKKEKNFDLPCPMIEKDSLAL
jgi:hypothetical protein